VIEFRNYVLLERLRGYVPQTSSCSVLGLADSQRCGIIASPRLCNIAQMLAVWISFNWLFGCFFVVCVL
jgi:hypothetical protein